MAPAWRVGRKVGRTIYRQRFDQASGDDELVGMMDTPELAAQVVEALNRTFPRPTGLPTAEDVRGIFGA